MKFIILDTNVVVSAMISHLDHGHPAHIFQRLVQREFVPVYSSALFEEYEEVLRRPKFNFKNEDINVLLGLIRNFGMREERELKITGLPLCVDPDDQVFYALAHTVDALLISGNTKHFPSENRIFTPAEFDETRRV
ncbi:MAG: putative toxin-antitoxin system toxin component, PIN family [Christensenella sp.]